MGQFTTDVPGNNVTAEMENAFRLMNIARPWNFSLRLTGFTDSKTAKVISPAASESGVFAGEPLFDEAVHVWLVPVVVLPCPGLSTLHALSLPTFACSSCLIHCSSQCAAGARRLSRKLLQVSILTIDTQDRFNTYNDFASLDFDVQFNVGPLHDPPWTMLFLCMLWTSAACLGITIFGGAVHCHAGSEA